MADNPYKRGIVNRANMILNAGLTSQSGILFDDIDDTEFADYTTVSETDEPDKRIACFLYERILKQVLEDIRPQFACRYADLSYPYMVNQECGGWDYLFELPSDFLCLAASVDEGNPLSKVAATRDPEILHFKDYAHTVVGSDGNVYYCSTAHTSADATKPITGASYATYWTVDSTELLEGATWRAGMAYVAAGTGTLLASNSLNNAAGTGAYICYVAYAQAGRSDQPQYYPENFANALATRMAAEMALCARDFDRRQRLLEEYEVLAKPGHWHVENRHKARTRRIGIFESRTRG